MFDAAFPVLCGSLVVGLLLICLVFKSCHQSRARPCAGPFLKQAKPKALRRARTSKQTYGTMAMADWQRKPELSVDSTPSPSDGRSMNYVSAPNMRVRGTKSRKGARTTRPFAQLT